MKKILTFSILLALIAGCRTVYVDRPVYLSDSVKTVIHDTAYIQKVMPADTVLIIRKGLIVSPLTIDTKFLTAHAWIYNDSLFLAAKYKPQKDSMRIRDIYHTITKTPAPVTVTQYVTKNRFLEDVMYYAGWLFVAMLIGAIVALVIQLLIKFKVI